MVGIVQPETFNIFIRKIGYSVGLEKTYDRYRDFAELYSSTPQVRQKEWLHLIHERWALKTRNITDVFSSLAIVDVKNQSVYPGPMGEAAGICMRVLDDPTERADAIRYLLGLAITLADGDVFINCLASEFKSEQISTRLKKMVLGKREYLFKHFRSQAERESIATAITIERQKSNKGGASKAGLQSIANLGLSAAKTTLGLPPPKDVYSIEEPSVDYLRHVIPSRREWARSLGLITESEISPLGITWLEAFGASPTVQQGIEWSLLPTQFDINRKMLSTLTELKEHCPTTWDYVTTVVLALGGSYDQNPSNGTYDDFAKTTRELFNNYRELSQERRMLRNELPLLVALAAYAAIQVAKKKPIFDYYSWLKSDFLDKYHIKIRSSRTIELGIIVS